ncbi:MAG: FMN-binding glutamate synthase family protein [Gammaproteobacteria bacterium]|nr:FMN-binding glutamate synthase family protein [Gammaproteobacteria bacterium]
MTWFNDYIVPVLQFLATLFITAIGIAVLAVFIMYIRDKTQRKKTILRNYPVIGRFRYFFEHLGEFFRQYFFAMDREELPFNRAQRSWVYRAAKNLSTTTAFGSTKNLTPEGTVIFVNAAYPPQEHEKQSPTPLTIGPQARKPYVTSSFFNISAMSFGSLSKPAIQALSRGAKQAGIWLNTGEGGLSPYHLEGGCDVVFQLGTAKYGARDKDGNLDENKLKEIANYPQVKMIELKLAQGAKPGKGGILPAEKVTPEIAKIRGIPAGQASLSPNRHLDAGNNEELIDLINRLRNVSGLPVGIKIVLSSEFWMDEFLQAILKRGPEYAPDFITVDGGDGGTGAAPQALIDEMGLQLKESLPLLVDKLNEYGLRKRIKVIASGKRINPSEVAWALCMGADFVNNARGFMFALGCIQAMQCNKNTCPTGITTHDEKLQSGLVVENKAERVANFAKTMRKEVETIAHSCGAPEPRKLKRRHARIVSQNGLSVPLNQLHPDKSPASD